MRQDALKLQKSMDLTNTSIQSVASIPAVNVTASGERGGGDSVMSFDEIDESN